MTRLILWLVTGLLLALGVHVATLFAIPHLAAQSPRGALRAIAPDGVFAVIPIEAMPYGDPSMQVATCHFDLTDAPVRVRVRVAGGFTSVSVHTSLGLNQYSLNDRAAVRGAIDFTIYTPAQLADARSREGPDTPETLRIAAAEPTGIVAVRTLVPFPTMAGEATEALGQATCQSVPR